MGEVKNSRSGSETRQTTKQLNMRLTPAEHAALDKLAQEYGQSLPALLRKALLSIPLPRNRRPRVDDKLMRQFFFEISRAVDAVNPVKAELGKSGSNMNQIAAVLNADRAPETVMNIVRETFLAHHQATLAVEEFIRDLRELRTAGMNTMGLELQHGSDDGDK